MKPQYTNKLMSSLMLYLDNKILAKGESSTNVSTYFYPNDTVYNGYYTYSSPYNQIIPDSSVSGATIMTGVFLNNTFIGTGQSGFAGIDYYKGRLYFTTPIPSTSTISGSYAIKEYNIAITNDPEEVLLFETKYSPKPKTNQTLSGVGINEIQYPIVFIRNNAVENEPFAFGGLDLTRNYIRFLVLSDSEFSNDAVNNIISDLKESYIPVLTEAEFPFNYLGHLKSGFNYTGMTVNSASNDAGAFIEDIKMVKFNEKSFTQELQNINTEVYVSIIDIEAVKARYPRQS